MTPARLESPPAAPWRFDSSAFRIFQLAVARDDQRAAQRDHHQDPEQPAEHRDQQDARDFQVEAENKDRGHGDAQAERDRLARRARGLHDVVLEDGGIAHARLRRKAKEGDRDHRHRNGRADRKAHLEHQVERRGAEQHAEEHAHDDGAQGEFGESGVVGYEGLMGGRAGHCFLRLALLSHGPSGAAI
jgi:hypothetical protein